MQPDQETGKKFLSEGHEYATSNLRARNHVAGQAICERLSDVHWNRDFGEHLSSLYKQMLAVETSHLLD